MITNIVFSGGGVRCLAYMGVLKYFEHEDLKKGVQTIVGTSGGALFALVFILNYTFVELQHLALHLDLNSLQDISSENLFKFFSNYGLDSGHKLDRFIDLLIEKKLGKKQVTFLELYKLYNIKLIINGTCVNTRTVEYFNHITTPNMLVNTAIRISCSIPIMFNSVNIGDKVYVDGGIVDNYPMDIFKHELCKTLGFYILYKNDKHDEINSIDKFMLNILLAINNKFESLLLENYKDNTVIIESDVGHVDFNISDTDKLNIIKKGFDSTKKHLDIAIISNVLDDLISQL